MPDGSPRRTAKVFGRYMLFQLPGFFAAGGVLLLLERWTELTPRLAALLFGLWVLKDLLLFPVTRIAYERGGRPHGADALLGATGVAREGLAQGRIGYVRVGPELWRARLAEHAGELPEGASIRVVAVRDLTLVVERAGS